MQALDRVHADIAAEKVREALELTTRARCSLDARDLATARRLAMDAVARSPGKATRYLFTRGLTEVAAGDTAAVQATVNALRALAAPASDPDRGEEKAADYLQGLRQLQGGESTAAVTSLRASVQAKGYEFDVYAVALARALAEQGNVREARTLARQASARGSAADLRLDLEHSRRDAARLLQQLGG
jgi:hypothetical protein